MADEWGRQGHDIDVIRRAVGIVDQLMGASYKELIAHLSSAHLLMDYHLRR
jgi:hypothetical protein